MPKKAFEVKILFAEFTEQKDCNGKPEIAPNKITAK